MTMRVGCILMVERLLGQVYGMMKRMVILVRKGIVHQTCVN